MKILNDGKVDKNQDKENNELLIEMSSIIAPIMPSIIKSITAITESVKRNKFMDLLKGMALFFESHDNKLNAKKDIEKFKYILENQEENEIISNLLEIAFMSKNTNCRIILGIITGKYLVYNSLDYYDTTIANALNGLFDDDLFKFFIFTRDSKKMMKDEKNDPTCFISDYKEKDRLILDKLQNLNLLGHDLAGSRLMGDMPFLRYQITLVSERLMNYIIFLKNNNCWICE